MRTVYFHEDDYCQYEILPLTDREYCLEEMTKIAAFEKEHRIQSGPYTFYSDIYVRGSNPYNIKESLLRPEQLDDALEFLPAYDVVETGYSSHRSICPAARCRGSSSGIKVFWSVDKDGIVNSIWLDLRIEPEQKAIEESIRTLSSLGQLAPLLLADWNSGECVNLSSPQEIEQYFRCE